MIPYLDILTIIASINKTNPEEDKEGLKKILIDFDEGLKNLEGSDEYGPKEYLLEEYRKIRIELVDWVNHNVVVNFHVLLESWIFKLKKLKINY